MVTGDTGATPSTGIVVEEVEDGSISPSAVVVVELGPGAGAGFSGGTVVPGSSGTDEGGTELTGTDGLVGLVPLSGPAGSDSWAAAIGTTALNATDAANQVTTHL